MDTETVANLISIETAKDQEQRGSRVAVLPVGSFEQHGAYLPLATDAIVASLISRRICDDYGLFLLPPVTFGCSHEHAGFAGTVSISAVTLYHLVTDVWRSLQASGFAGLVVVNGHGGNYVLQNVVQEANIAGTVMALYPTGPDWTKARLDADLDLKSGTPDMHAGELEVSLLLHGAPESVREGYETSDFDAPDWPRHLLEQGMRPYAPEGVIGRPSAGTAVKGKALLDSLSESFASHLELLAK